jgi:heat shock protein HtpX
MTTPTIGLSTHIWNNNLRSVALLVFYPILVAGIFWTICWALGLAFNNSGAVGAYPLHDRGAGTSVSFANTLLWEYWPLIFTGVAIWFVIAWFFHTKMIRKISHSHPVTREDEPDLYNMLENLCISRGIAMPKLEIIETHARNAFASGINQSSYTITITRGLLNTLQKDEIEGVMAHELTHILNRDVRLLIVTVIFTGLFGFLAQLVWSNVRYNLFYTRGRRDNNGGVVIAIIVIAIILWLGYIATLLMRFMLSRSREYMADAGAIELTKNPEAMMRALMRIAGKDRIPETTDDIAMMCIENHVPFLGLFATHPPIDKRIAMLSATTGTPIPQPPKNISADPLQSFGRPEDKPRRNPWLTRARRD